MRVHVLEYFCNTTAATAPVVPPVCLKSEHRRCCPRTAVLSTLTAVLSTRALVLSKKLTPLEGPGAPMEGPGVYADDEIDEEPATPVQAVAAKVPRKQKHKGASPLLVAAAPIPHNSPPPVPVFVARYPSLPPPERQPRPAPIPRYKRKAGVHRGSDVLVTKERCPDTCPYACCLNGGFSEAQITTWRQQLRDADAKGPGFRRAYLLSLMGRQSHSGRPSGQFKSRPRVAGATGSCAWYSTVAGPLDRAHWYNANKCPQYQQGQDWLNGKITKRSSFQPYRKGPRG